METQVKGSQAQSASKSRAGVCDQAVLPADAEGLLIRGGGLSCQLTCISTARSYQSELHTPRCSTGSCRPSRDRPGRVVTWLPV